MDSVNRAKNLEIMKTLELKKSITLTSNEDLSTIELSHEGAIIGTCFFEVDGFFIFPESVDLDETYRGLGLYKDVIDFVIENMEEMAGVDEFRSVQRTEAANKFWQKYTSVEDYDEAKHDNGEQEAIIIDSNWNISYE